ncbi:hypothetical protein KCMC57_up47760 [Kitasatospora sp. CMC57]|uniref:DUF3618 domain-containing protein n=1 Tax=Kitasatospora sp. CMC57 TaxID=3231513 RepID=A0AB33JYY1_9ACTN
MSDDECRQPDAGETSAEKTMEAAAARLRADTAAAVASLREQAVKFGHTPQTGRRRQSVR